MKAKNMLPNILTVSNNDGISVSHPQISVSSNTSFKASQKTSPLPNERLIMKPNYAIDKRSHTPVENRVYSQEYKEVIKQNIVNRREQKMHVNDF